MRALAAGPRRGTVGITDVSTTRRPSIPCTRNSGSTTARGSDAGPSPRSRRGARRSSATTDPRVELGVGVRAARVGIAMPSEREQLGREADHGPHPGPVGAAAR